MDAQKDSHNDSRGGSGMNMTLMMVVMMGMCLVSFTVFALIPAIGWPAGVAIGIIAFGAMVWVHQRLMGGGPH